MAEPLGPEGATGNEPELTPGELSRVLDDRGSRADQRDAARAAARKGDKRLLDAADKRDDRADDRDQQADVRDSEADRHAFLTSSDYGHDLSSRRHAAADRSASRGDRVSAASDRARLTAAQPVDDDGGSDSAGSGTDGADGEVRGTDFHRPLAD